MIISLKQLRRGTVFIKCSYTVFYCEQSLHSTSMMPSHSIYHINYGYYSVFNKYTTLVLSYRKFAPSPLGLRFYQWQSSSDLRLRSYIYQIHLLAMAYIYTHTHTPDITAHNLVYHSSFQLLGWTQRALKLSRQRSWQLRKMLIMC